MGKILGIDLGTTNSCMAVMEGGRPKVIHSSEGRNVVPSVVDPVERTIGDVAKRQMVLKPKKIISSVKRLIGRRLSDESVQKDIKLLPYTVNSGRDQMATVEVDGNKYVVAPFEEFMYNVNNNFETQLLLYKLYTYKGKDVEIAKKKAVEEETSTFWDGLKMAQKKDSTQTSHRKGEEGNKVYKENGGFTMTIGG